MKKFLKSLLIIALATLSIASCKKELALVQEEGNLVEATFTADPVNLETRTHINETTAKFEWDEADTKQSKTIEFIEIIDDGATLSFTYNNADGEVVDGKANFISYINTKLSGSTYKYTAVYPYSAWDKSTESNNVGIVLPAEQKPSADSYDKNGDLLVANINEKEGKSRATTGDILPLSFRRISAVGKITLKNLPAGETVKQVVFGTSEVVLAGKVKVDILTEMSTPDWSEATDKAITVNYPTAVASSTPIWFTCKPSTIEIGQTYIVTVITNEAQYVKSGTIASKELTFKAGAVTSFGVDFTSAVVTPIEEPAVEIPFLFETSESIGGTELAAIEGISTSGIANYSAANGRLKFDGTNDNIIIRSKSAVGSVELRGNYNSASGSENSKMQILGSANGDDFTLIQEFICGTSGTYTHKTSSSINPDYRFIKINFVKSNANVGVGYIKLAEPSTDPIIVAADITAVNAAGVENGLAEYSALNFTDDVQVTSFTGCVTAAAIDASLIEYSVAPNYSGEKQSGTIVLVSESNPSITATINVSQEADKFSASKLSIVIGGESTDYATFDVTSTYDFNITNPNEEKIEVEKGTTVDGKTTITVMAVLDNTSGAVDVIGDIIITRITSEETPKSLQIGVSQNAQQAEGEVYTLVTDVNTLAAGDKVIIAALESDLALSITQNTNNRGAVAIVKDGDTLSDIRDAAVLNLGGNADDGFTFFDPLYETNQGGYLYAAGGTGKNNYLKTKSTLDNTARWSISIAASGEATIKTKDTTVVRHTIFKNSTGNLFSCYASGQAAVCIYKLN